jgi:DNA helicase-2/ATP-dependent DNA helicase PcrA
LSFYQRKEIKDILAYLRFTVNQQDTEAFKRIINLPKRGIGSQTVAKLIIAANDNNLPIWGVVNNIRAYFDGRAANSIANFADLIRSYQILLEQGDDAHKIAMHVAQSTGILRELYADKTVEGLARYENIQELLNSIKQYVDNEENDDKSLAAFLQNVSLLTNADQDDEDGDNDRVTMMSIHGSKGLEFTQVFVVGLEENLFPSQMMLQSRDDLEEERRLFYVAITRAEKELTLSYAESRYHYGRLNYCEPSRFLLEIDPTYLNLPKEPTRPMRKSFTDDADVVSSFGNKKERLLSNLKPVNRVQPAKPHVSTGDFKATNPNELSEGAKVEHQKFGFGRIVKLDQSGSSTKATVLFKTQGEKTLLLSFAKLRLVE